MFVRAVLKKRLFPNLLFNSLRANQDTGIVKYILAVFCSFICLGCSTTKVHLYGRYLPAETLQSLNKTLAESGYRVEVNDFEFPGSIQQSAVIYSPLVENRDRVKELLVLLSDLDWPVDYVRMLKAGNHWYSKNSLALFLLPGEINPHNQSAIPDLSHKYIGRNCDADISITLKADQCFMIEIGGPEQRRRQVQQGSWSFTEYPYMLIKPQDTGGWGYFMKIDKSIETDKVGNIEMLHLMPQDEYQVLAGCTFVYGVRA